MFKNTALLFCDIQKKTIKHLQYKDLVINNINKLLYIKPFLDNWKLSIKSEFIPNKLGNIDEKINKCNIDFIYEKYTYSMYNNFLKNKLTEHKINNIILTGMEIQWCINQTVYDLTKDFTVHIPVDAVGNSLNLSDNYYNLKNLENNGALLTTTDSIICNNLNNANEKSSKEYVNYLKKIFK